MDLYYCPLKDKNPDNKTIKKVILDVFEFIHYDIKDLDKIYLKIKFKGE